MESQKMGFINKFQKKSSSFTLKSAVFLILSSKETTPPLELIKALVVFEEKQQLPSGRDTIFYKYSPERFEP